jgi:hypothetical protein
MNLSNCYVFLSSKMGRISRACSLGLFLDDIFYCNWERIRRSLSDTDLESESRRERCLEMMC